MLIARIHNVCFFSFSLLDIINFSSVFSNGYLIGETLSKYKLQDDLDQFSQQK